MIPSYVFSLLTAATLLSSSIAVEQVPITYSAPTVAPVESLRHDVDIVHCTHLRIDFSTPEAANTTNDILRNIMSPRAQYPVETIRNITVSGYLALGEWSLVTKIFNKVTNLETVHWHNEKAIPSHIIRSLKKNNPSCRLYYTLDFSWRNEDFLSTPDEPIAYLKHLWLKLKTWKESRNSVSWSTNLHSLKINIMYNGRDNTHDLATVFNIVASAPNLKELDLHLARQGCVLAETAWSFDFGSHPSTRFPPLEVLRLNGYALEDGPGGWSWTEWWASVKDFFAGGERMHHPPGLTDPLTRQERIARNDTNLDMWMRRMDWSQIHTLEISEPSDHVLSIIEGDALPALRNLVISRYYSGYDRNKVMDFITKTKEHLKSLSLIRFDLDSDDEFIVDADLRRELKSFTLRPKNENTEPIHGSILHTMLATSPKLESIDVTVEREEDIAWQERPWKEFIYCHTLRHLTLRLPSPDGPDVDYRSWPEDEIDPMINNERNLELFRRMRKLKNGAELESMHFYVGDWGNRNLMTQAPRGNFRVGFYSCFMDRGKEKCEGIQVIQR